MTNSSDKKRGARLLSVPEATPEALAAYVVVYRTLGMDKELAALCMKELANRRADGLEFDYESYIEEKVAEMPNKQDLNLVTISKEVHKGVQNNLKITKHLNKK